ncbi:unnamed protein product [Caenorhabditis angaria]|uniref:RING-type domain-containing protein n=1 Tax=Caenorhabditis angaria TaxID=860376 RepID=A0A9P1IX02_9PELO|nr:unnamed protein product [Caenorhabditis angaria]
MSRSNVARECRICFSDYDLESHRPCVGQCGHSICEYCTERIETTNCPICNRRDAFRNKIINYHSLECLEEIRQEDRKKQEEEDAELARIAHELEMQCEEEMRRDYNKHHYEPPITGQFGLNRQRNASSPSTSLESGSNSRHHSTSAHRQVSPKMNWCSPYHMDHEQLQKRILSFIVEKHDDNDIVCDSMFYQEYPYKLPQLFSLHYFVSNYLTGKIRILKSIRGQIYYAPSQKY